MLGDFLRREFGRGQIYTYILLVMVLGFILSGCVGSGGSDSDVGDRGVVVEEVDTGVVSVESLR